MGITFGGALLMVILAYIAQSPGFAARIGLGGGGLGYRVKTFTGYALAFMLLCLGFFLAGVPIDPALVATAVPTPTTLANTQPDAATAVSDMNGITTGTAITPTQTISDPTSAETAAEADADQTPSSGAFGGPPPGQEETASGDEADPNATPTMTASPAATPTPTPVTATPTATATPSPTITPSPTTTPTPIIGVETAVMDLGGSVIWLRRSPGGQQLLVLEDQQLVILRSGHAIRSGVLWREVSTGDGTTGWVEAQFLQIPEAE